MIRWCHRAFFTSARRQQYLRDGQKLFSQPSRHSRFIPEVDALGARVYSARTINREWYFAMPRYIGSVKNVTRVQRFMRPAWGFTARRDAPFVSQMSKLARSSLAWTCATELAHVIRKGIGSFVWAPFAVPPSTPSPRPRVVPLSRVARAFIPLLLYDPLILLVSLRLHKESARLKSVDPISQVPGSNW